MGICDESNDDDGQLCDELNQLIILTLTLNQLCAAPLMGWIMIQTPLGDFIDEYRVEQSDERKSGDQDPKSRGKWNNLGIHENGLKSHYILKCMGK